MRKLVLSIGLLCLSGCAVTGSREATTVAYDFGPSVDGLQHTAAGPRLSSTIVLEGVTAPAWMDNSGMYYRLAYQNPATPQRYAESRWVMSPAALLTARLRASIAHGREGIFVPAGNDASHEYSLAIELDEFDQIFDQADRSRVLVAARATLRGSDRSRRERVFVIERPAPTPDAAGGARALTQATDELVSRIIDWAGGAQSDAPLEQAASMRPTAAKVR